MDSTPFERCEYMKMNTEIIFKAIFVKPKKRRKRLVKLLTGVPLLPLVEHALVQQRPRRRLGLLTALVRKVDGGAGIAHGAGTGGALTAFSSHTHCPYPVAFKE